jgi:hypothetical protein
MHFVTKTTLLAAGVAAAFATAGASPAAANGCNGYVNQLQWGCAAWDNNNGPQFPHYQAARAPAAQPAPSAVLGNNPRGLVAAGGGNLVAAGGGNVQAGGHHPGD